MPKEIQLGKVYGITDDYMFFTVMQDKPLCTRLLQELIQLHARSRRIRRRSRSPLSQNRRMGPYKIAQTMPENTRR